MEDSKIPRFQDSKIFNLSIFQSSIFKSFILCLLVFLTRFLFKSQTLYHWDSVQFAGCLTFYDVRQHLPHPPGYFLYCAVGRFFFLLTPDENSALVFLSIFSSVVCGALLYQFCKTLFDDKTAVVCFFLFLTSPLAWFYGEVALSYMAEAAAGSFLLLHFWNVHKSMLHSTLNTQHSTLKKGGFPILSGFLFGLLSGIRQSLFVFYAPVFLYSLSGRSWKVKILSLGSAFLGGFLWFFPSVLFSGGYRSFSEALNFQWKMTVQPWTFLNLGVKAFLINSVVVFTSLCYMFFLFLVPCYAYARRGLRGQCQMPNSKSKIQNSRTTFLLLALCPGLLFYVLVFIDQPGYLLTLSAPLFPAVSRAWVRFDLVRSGVPRHGTSNGVDDGSGLKKIFFYTALFLNVFLFALYDSPSMVTTASEIKRHDRTMLSLVSCIRKNLSPETTLILTPIHALYSIGHSSYYLKEYASYQVDPKKVRKGGRLTDVYVTAERGKRRREERPVFSGKLNTAVFFIHPFQYDGGTFHSQFFSGRFKKKLSCGSFQIPVYFFKAFDSKQ